MSLADNLRRSARDYARDLRTGSGNPHAYARARWRIGLERVLDRLTEENPDQQAAQLRTMAASARHAGRLDSARFLLNSARRFRQRA